MYLALFPYSNVHHSLNNKKSRNGFLEPKYRKCLELLDSFPLRILVRISSYTSNFCATDDICLIIPIIQGWWIGKLLLDRLCIHVRLSIIMYATHLSWYTWNVNIPYCMMIYNNWPIMSPKRTRKATVL